MYTNFKSKSDKMPMWQYILCVALAIGVLFCAVFCTWGSAKRTTAKADTVTGMYTYTSSHVAIPTTSWNISSSIGLTGAWDNDCLSNFNWSLQFDPEDEQKRLDFGFLNCSFVKILGSELWPNSSTRAYFLVEDTGSIGNSVLVMPYTSYIRVESGQAYAFKVSTVQSAGGTFMVFFTYDSSFWDYENPFISSYTIYTGPYIYTGANVENLNWPTAFNNTNLIGKACTRVQYRMGTKGIFFELLFFSKSGETSTDMISERTVYTDKGKDLLLGADYQGGYDDGYAYGYSDGEKFGQQSGYADGYKAGFAVGETSGKNTGYQEGVSAANDYSFFSLISAVVDVPIQAFTSLFDFEILGINMQSFFLSLMTVCVIIAVLRLIF